MPARRRPVDPAQLLPLSPQVLHVLLALGQGPLHGYALIQRVRDQTSDEIRLTASTLYDALARLVDQGLIEEVNPPDVGGDARRRYYAMTGVGRDVVKAEVARLERAVQRARVALDARKGTSR
jgi:DNA-binding PadR family transcriptional regulator